MPTFSYLAFGLNICSDLECVGLLPGNGEPDVYVRLGRVPEQLDNPLTTGVFYQATQGQVLLNMKHVARYRISSGEEIVVDLAPGADMSMVLLLLFGSAFGALLHQRKVWVVHGSAIATARGAVVFAGASGYGKSTLAGIFCQRGFPVLADDVCAVNTDDVPFVLPASPFLMLWADTANRLSINEHSLQRARSGLEKYVLPLGRNFASEPIPLHAIYLLEPSNLDSFSLIPMHGFQKMKTLNLATYRPHFIEGMNLSNQHFSQIGAVARQTKVAVVRRPRGGFRLNELADLLGADFAA